MKNNLKKEIKNLTTPRLTMPKIYSFDQVKEILLEYGQELVKEAKRRLPTHKGKMLSRKEVKDVLDKLI